MDIDDARGELTEDEIGDVKSVPTFKIYSNGRMIEKFESEDSNKLINSVNQLERESSLSFAGGGRGSRRSNGSGEYEENQTIRKLIENMHGSNSNTNW